MYGTLQPSGTDESTSKGTARQLRFVALDEVNCSLQVLFLLIGNP